jgi:hypothetical protein
VEGLMSGDFPVSNDFPMEGFSSMWSFPFVQYGRWIDGVWYPLNLSSPLPAGPTGDPVETTKQKRNCDTASALEGRTGQGLALQGILPDLPVWLL